MKPHNAYAESSIEIEGTEVLLRLFLEYVPESIPPRDHIGRPLEPREAAGYVILNAEWQNPFDDNPDWEAVPALIMDIIQKNERELLERADREVAV